MKERIKEIIIATAIVVVGYLAAIFVGLLQ